MATTEYLLQAKLTLTCGLQKRLHHKAVDTSSSLSKDTSKATSNPSRANIPRKASTLRNRADIRSSTALLLLLLLLPSSPHTAAPLRANTSSTTSQGKAMGRRARATDNSRRQAMDRRHPATGNQVCRNRATAARLATGRRMGAVVVVVVLVVGTG